jgi:tetratricopeptide (TPR) repeat protein
MTYIMQIQKKIIVLSLLLTVSIYSYAAQAQDQSVQQEFNEVFNKMLDNPADVDLIIKYANLAIELKDYEAAIPALERLLLFNPDLPKIKQELGVLYYRLNSFDMAKYYLESAKAGKNVPQDVIDLVNQYLSKIK